jgi:hypothetical protein
MKKLIIGVVVIGALFVPGVWECVDQTGGAVLRAVFQILGGLGTLLGFGLFAGVLLGLGCGLLAPWCVKDISKGARVASSVVCALCILAGVWSCTHTPTAGPVRIKQQSSESQDQDE